MSVTSDLLFSKEFIAQKTVSIRQKENKEVVHTRISSNLGTLYR